MMRKNTGFTKLLQRAAALMLSTAVAACCVLSVGAEAPEESNGYGEYVQKVALYGVLGDNEAGLRYFDQLVQQDAGDLSAYLARAQMRQMAGDLAGARQDCDYAIGHLTANKSENTEIWMYGYKVRAALDFLQGNQAQYLADAQTHQDFTSSLFDTISLYSGGEAVQEWQETKTKAEANLKELRSWYNNGAPAKSFQTEHTRVSGGIGDTTIQLHEEWSEDTLDTVYDTTFQLSQPVRNVTRKAPFAEVFAYAEAVVEVDDSEDGAVAYFVPAGTVVTMQQQFQSGKNRAKNYSTFRAEDLTGKEMFQGESMTVEAGKIYRLDYASADSMTVYFIAV